MPSPITSRVEIKIDGAVVLNKPGFTFRPGGIQRESVMGDAGVHGYTEVWMPARLAGNLTHTEQQNLEAYGGIKDATIVISTNTNQQYVMRNAWQTDAPELNAQSGEVGVAYESAPAEKM